MVLLGTTIAFLTACEGFDQGQSPEKETATDFNQTAVSPTFSWPDTQNDAWAQYNWTDAETIPTEGDDVEDYYENTSFTSTVTVTYAGTTATVDDPDGKVTATITGAHVVLNCQNKDVQFVLAGKSTNGSITFYTSNKFLVTLNGLSLHNPTGPAFNNQSKKRTFVHLANDTQNTLSDGASYETNPDEDAKACLFSEAQLIFSGKGSLTVQGAYKHGICSDDYIRIRPFATISVTTSSAKGDGLHANEFIQCDGGQLTIVSVKDGMEAEGIEDESGVITEGNILLNGGVLNVTTSGEKGHALKAEGNLVMNGGLVTVNVSGGASKGMNVTGNVDLLGGKFVAITKGTGLFEEDEDDVSSAAGIKCDGNFTLSNAGVYLTSSGLGGKGINAEGTLTVQSGRLEITTTGKQYVYQELDTSPKGMKADGDLTINNGVVIVKATGGEGSEGIESKSKIYINGGTVEVNTYDDALNATHLIQITDGFVYACSTGNDAIDSGTDDSGSQGLLTLGGGVVIAIGTRTPEGGFDCDNHTFTITGGTLLGLGGSSSTPTAGVCTQNAVVCGVGSVSDKAICLRSAAGANLFVMQVPSLSALQSQTTMLFSSPQLATGTSYSIYTGGTASGSGTFHGLYSAGAYTGGSVVSTFTPTSRVTTLQLAPQGLGGW